MAKNETASVKEASVPEVKDKQPKPSGWGLGRLFWGLLLVLIGGLILLDNINVLDVRLGNLWQLWPLFIIAAGFSVLSFRGKLWNLLGLLLVLISLGAATWVALDTSMPSNAETTMSDVGRLGDQIKQVDLTLKTGASNLTIDSRDSDVAVAAELRSNISRISQKTETDGTTQKVRIETESLNEWHWRGNMQNELDISLTRRLPMVVHVEAGASNIDADLSGVKLRSLNVDSGASSITLRLGNLVADTNISIDAGASSVTLYIPKDSGVRFTIDGGLNAKSLGDLTEVSEDVYESKDFAGATKKITITGDFGLASITIERY